MEILEIISKRRSIRKYKKELPRDSDIEKILEAARWAPSGLNNQPWKFSVIKDKNKKDGLAKFTKYGSVIKIAPLAIMVCLDLTASYHREKDLMAIGACIQNMLLETQSLGLGACWLGEIWNKKEEVAQYLKLDKNLELVAVIAIGYPDEKIFKGSRRPLENLIIKP